jgi:hypothetical protein
MDFDDQRVDEPALALLHLTIHEGNRVWKTIDWEVMNRLHARGFISRPDVKAKSVILTDEGMSMSEQAVRKLFAKARAAG